jgi:hypothetical protein
MLYRISLRRAIECTLIIWAIFSQQHDTNNDAYIYWILEGVFWKALFRNGNKYTLIPHFIRQVKHIQYCTHSWRICVTSSTWSRTWPYEILFFPLWIGQRSFSRETLRHGVRQLVLWRLFLYVTARLIFVIIFYYIYCGETESTWYCGHCLASCTSPRW